MWWIDPGTLTASDDVAFACLKAPGMCVEPERAALTTLAAHLADREALICLGTCEHVLDGATALRAGCYEPRDLPLAATGREPLTPGVQC